MNTTANNQIIAIDDINCCYDRSTTSFHPIEGREKEFEESMRKIEDKYLKEAGIALPASEEARATAREYFASVLLESTLESIGVAPNDKEQEMINKKDELYNKLNNFKKNKKQMSKSSENNAAMIKSFKQNLFDKR